jgi:hypothetical protein
MHAWTPSTQRLFQVLLDTMLSQISIDLIRFFSFLIIFWITQSVHPCVRTLRASSTRCCIYIMEGMLTVHNDDGGL